VIGAFWGVIFGARQAGAEGTHFVVEPYTGIVFNQGFNLENAVGFESGAFLGVGGKLKGFPPRFYLYFSVSQTFFGDDDVYLSHRDAHGEVCRSYTRLVGGLRTVIPLFWRLRLNLDVAGGSLFSQNHYQESGVRPIEYSEDLVVVELGAGLNWRFFEWLSVGLMVDYTFVAEDESGDLIASILDEANRGAKLGWSHLSLTVGFHF